MNEPGSCRNVADLLRRSAEAQGPKAALLCGERSLSWTDLDQRVDALASALAAKWSPGERVGIALANTLEFATVYFAALRAGLVAVPMNTGYTGAELQFLLEDSGARVVFFDTFTEQAATAAVGGTSREPPLLVDCGQDPAARKAEETLVFLSLPELMGPPGVEKVAAIGGAEDLAVLLYTSGTSGRPRGAMLSHRALTANLMQLAAIDPPVVSTDDVVLVVPPLFHIYGLNVGLGMAAWTGATAVLVDRFDPVATLAEIGRRKVTTIVGAPPMYVAWSMLPELRQALSGVRLAVSGSASLPTEVMIALRDGTGCPIYEGYGLTETAPVLTSTLASETVKPGSIGRPIPGVALRLREHSGGAELDEGDPGEIVVRGANLFSGYWPDGRGAPDTDGWFATGDLAYQDPDGDLFLVGRLRELVIVSGFNVYPAEVESVLDSHPGVAESAVLAIPHPYTGESVKALVVRREGVALSAEELIAFASASLARFKCPTVVEFVEALPHSVAGKVAKGRLVDSPPAASAATQ